MFQSRKASRSTNKVFMYNSVYFGGNRLVYSCCMAKEEHGAEPKTNS